MRTNKMDLEGIVAKHSFGPYVTEVQRTTWFKIKNRNYSQMAGREELFKRERHSEPVGDHFRNIDDPENALVARELWFDNLPAVMRVRVTTPNVLRALRKRDPGAAKPYNFALSPILMNPSPDCTLIAPASKSSKPAYVYSLIGPSLRSLRVNWTPFCQN